MEKPKQRKRVVKFPKYISCKVTDEQFAFLQLQGDRATYLRFLIQPRIDRWKSKGNNAKVLKRKINKIKREE